jgi:hypothetical protein
MLMLIFLLLHITKDTCKIYYDKAAKKYREMKDYRYFIEIHPKRKK